MKPLAKMTVLVVGLGQIGGSMAMELRRGRIVKRVIGHDTNRTAVKQAKQIGIIDDASASLIKGVREADLIILAMPIRRILDQMPFILPQLGDHQMCMDVASTKRQIVRIANDLKVTNFVGGHPIAGTEKQGLAGAARHLFRDRTFVLTPPRLASKTVIARSRQLVRALGGRPLVMTAERHDRLMAQTSHLPYALALALVQSTQSVAREDRRLLDLIGGSFRSATRVARSSPELTADMLLTNSDAVGRAIDAFIKELSTVGETIRKGDPKTLLQLAQSANRNALRMDTRGLRRGER